MIFMALASVGAAGAQKFKPAEVLCGPYVQCVTQTGFTITWTTDIDAVGWVEVAPDDGTHFYNKARDKYYDRRGFGVMPVGRIHKVEVDGLEPGCRYRYRIMTKGVNAFTGVLDVEFTRSKGTNVYRGQPYFVSTLKEAYDTVRFDIYNDIHERDSLLDVLMAKSRKNLDFVALNGDMTHDLSSADKIQKLYMRTVSKHLGGSVPLVVTRGNHEIRGRESARWADYFATPTGTPYYSFSIGKFFFIVLDAGEDKPDNDIEYSGMVVSDQYLKQQEKWLAEVLASDECRNAQARFVFCHVAPESKGWYGMARLYNTLVPHLNKADIGAMFCGHIHRWRVSEPDGELSNAQFPVICNPNVQRMEVVATAQTLEVNTYDTNGVKTNTHSRRL